MGNNPYQDVTPFTRRLFTSLLGILLSLILLCKAPCKTSRAGDNSDGIEMGISKNEAVVKEIKLAMEAFYRMDFQQAESIFDEAIKEWPDDLMPYLYKGGFYLEQFNYFKGGNPEEDRRLRDAILSLNNKVIELAGKRIEKDPDDIAALYYLGAGHGNIGRFYVIDGKWLKGFWTGKKGFNILERVVDSNPDYYDAYLGLGIYHYFSATMPKVVKVLSFLLGGPEGDREKGIKELQLVRDRSSLLSVEARKILLRVFRWEEDWNGFYITSKWLAEHYPENLYFQIPYIYGLTKYKRLKEAQQQRDRVETWLNNDTTGLPINIRLKYLISSGLLSYHLGEYSRAVRSYQEAISLAAIGRPSERIWAEDYYYLAASYARLMQEDEAVRYLRQAAENGWETAGIEKQPEWRPYINNPEFIKIVGR